MPLKSIISIAVFSLSLSVAARPWYVAAIVIARSGTDPGVNADGNKFKMGSSYDKTLTDQIVEAGDQLLSIDLPDLRNGLCIYRIKVNNSPIVAARLVKGNY